MSINTDEEIDKLFENKNKVLSFVSKMLSSTFGPEATGTSL